MDLSFSAKPNPPIKGGPSMIRGDINLFSRKVKEKGHFLLSSPFLSDFYFPQNPINLVEDPPPVAGGTAEPVKGYDK